MSPKEEAKHLLSENSSLVDPMNFALHLCDEIIYDFEHYVPDKQKLKHWKLVKVEIENIRNLKKE
jgi:hypothetical protein